MKIEFVGTEPTKAHKTDAGFDLYLDENIELYNGCNRIVKTGTRISIPIGYVGLIWPRSGLSAKYSVETGAGVIDHGYTGEILVKLYNHGYDPITLTKGMRIAQLLIQPILDAELYRVDSLESAERGENGHGSSGE